MSDKKTKLLEEITQFFLRKNRPALSKTTRDSATNGAEPVESFDVLPSSPDTYGIRVVDVDPVEFELEWARSTTTEVEIRLGATEEVVKLQDRRLPKFDRRHQYHDRRQGSNNDRRAQSEMDTGSAMLMSAPHPHKKTGTPS